MDFYGSRFFLLAFERLYFNFRSIQRRLATSKTIIILSKKSLESLLHESEVCLLQPSPQGQTRHTHDHPRFRFLPVSIRGGMQQYHHAMKDEKLLSSKKAISFLQRYWKEVIPSEACCSAASGANCR